MAETVPQNPKIYGCLPNILLSIISANNYLRTLTVFKCMYFMSMDVQKLPIDFQNKEPLWGWNGLMCRIIHVSWNDSQIQSAELLLLIKLVSLCAFLTLLHVFLYVYKRTPTLSWYGEGV